MIAAVVVARCHFVDSAVVLVAAVELEAAAAVRVAAAATAVDADKFVAAVEAVQRVGAVHQRNRQEGLPRKSHRRLPLRCLRHRLQLLPWPWSLCCSGWLPFRPVVSVTLRSWLPDCAMRSARVASGR